MKVPELRIEVAGDKFSYQISTGYTYIRAVLKNNAVKSFERSLKDCITHSSADGKNQQGRNTPFLPASVLPLQSHLKN